MAWDLTIQENEPVEEQEGNRFKENYSTCVMITFFFGQLHISNYFKYLNLTQLERIFYLF